MKMFAVVLALVAGVVGAAPSVLGSTTGDFSHDPADPTPHNDLMLPTGAVGDLLVLAVASDCSAGTMPTISTPSGWTARNPLYLAACAVQVFVRPSDGTESLVTVTSNGSQSYTTRYIALRLSPAALNSSVRDAFGTSTAPDTSLNVVMGAAPLWLAFVNSNATPTLAPSGYTNMVTSANANGVLAVAQKVGGSNFDNPLPWTLNASSPWYARHFGAQ